MFCFVLFCFVLCCDEAMADFLHDDRYAAVLVVFVSNNSLGGEKV